MKRVTFNVSAYLKKQSYGVSNDFDKFFLITGQWYGASIKLFTIKTETISINLDYVTMRANTLINKIFRRIGKLENVTLTQKNKFTEAIETVDIVNSRNDITENDSIIEDLYKAIRFLKSFDETVKYMFDNRTKFVYIVSVLYFNELNELESEEKKVFKHYNDAQEYYNARVEETEKAYTEYSGGTEKEKHLLKIYNSPDNNYYEIFDEVDSDATHIYLQPYVVE